jgi:hypothetical protein
MAQVEPRNRVEIDQLTGRRHRPQSLSFLCGRASPDSAEFVVRQGVGEALLSHWAARTNGPGFRGGGANRRKEEVAVLASAQRSNHPRPMIVSVRAGSKILRHGNSSRHVDYPIVGHEDLRREHNH